MTWFFGGGLSVTEILILVIGAMTALYFYLTRNFNYFTKLGVKGPKPLPFVGTMFEYVRRDMLEVEMEWYKKYGPVYGMFENASPVLVVGDPMMLRSIFQKDFNHFVDRRDFKQFGFLLPMFRKTLTALEGEEWKQLRSVVSPTFTTGKIKNMLFSMSAACDVFLDNFKEYARSGKELDTKKVFDCYTMDVVASSGFGIQLDSLKNPEHPFVVNSRNLAGTFRKIRPFVIFGRLLKFLPFNLVDPEIIKYFDTTIDNIVKSKTSNREANKNRVDFLQLLLEARKSDVGETCDDAEISDPSVFERGKYSAKKVLDDQTVKGQALQLFFAGFETTSSTLTHAAYCLATNPEAQDKLCRELDEKLGKEKITYDSLSDSNLPYLDAVINECMRIYPPAPRLERRCTQDYQYENVRVHKEMLVQIPVLALHHDENYFPEATKFIPERFLPENKSSIQPFTFLPFGAGPRNCVGMRFALFEVKLVLATLLREIKFTINPNTEIPLKQSLSRLHTSPLSLSVELRQ